MKFLELCSNINLELISDEEIKLLNIIAESLNISLDDVTDNLQYRSIRQWDSLGHITLILALEEYYEIEIDEQVRDELNNVEKIKRFILNKDIGAPLNGNVLKDKINRGLTNIIFDYTNVSHVDGKNGKLYYRGYSINEIVDKCTYEEVMYLLLKGRLPLKHELSEFQKQVNENISISEKIREIIFDLKDAHPIDVLRTTISALGALDTTKYTEDFFNLSVKILVQAPLILSIQEGYRRGREVKNVPPNLSYAGKLIYMILGREPEKEEEKILNRLLILQAEHSSNASSFAARVASSTKVDIYSAVTAAIATFAGELHGGAIEKVIQMLEEIKEPSNVKEYVKNRLEYGEPIMGFGHRVYQTEDPRATHLKIDALKISNNKELLKKYEILSELEKEMEPYSSKGMSINVDFYSSLIYNQLGFSNDLLIALFSVGRMSGWLAQIQEQNSNNILIRPILKYIGQTNIELVPLEKRS